MSNVAMVVENNVLTLTVDLTKRHGLSKSGKNMNIGTTGGNVALPQMPGVPAGTRVGVNVFCDKGEPAKAETTAPAAAPSVNKGAKAVVGR